MVVEAVSVTFLLGSTMVVVLGWSFLLSLDEMTLIEGEENLCLMMPRTFA